jgi:hypothetical protein
MFDATCIITFGLEPDDMLEFVTEFDDLGLDGWAVPGTFA